MDNTQKTDDVAESVEPIELAEKKVKIEAVRIPKGIYTEEGMALEVQRQMMARRHCGL